MKKLNLSSLLFTPMNYRDYGDSLREWLMAAIESNPTSFRKVSTFTGIRYRTLLRYVHGNSHWMSYENMASIRDFIRSLMRPGVFDNAGVDDTGTDESGVDDTSVDLTEDLKNEQFFES